MVYLENRPKCIVFLPLKYKKKTGITLYKIAKTFPLCVKRDFQTEGILAFNSGSCIFLLRNHVIGFETLLTQK